MMKKEKWFAIDHANYIKEHPEAKLVCDGCGNSFPMSIQNMPILGEVEYQIGTKETYVTIFCSDACKKSFADKKSSDNIAYKIIQ